MALNDISLQILKKRAAKFTNNSPFTMGLLGDSHIGQTNCPNNPAWYRHILKKLISKKVYLIIHGGDASDKGGTTLKSFVTITENELGYSTVNSSRTPIFVNIGNHDYLRGSKTQAVSRNSYTKNIGPHNSIINLFYNGSGPRVAVVLLDTGYTISAKLPSGENYSKILKNMEKEMIKLIKKHNTVKFIIDMHVPPQILGDTKNHKKFNSSHVLLTQYNSRFKQFIKDFTSRYPGRIMAITAHHKHGWAQKSALYFSYKTYDMKPHKIPVYLTAQGGHCDGNAQNAQYSFYILSFSSYKQNNKRYYRLSKVDRYNVTYDIPTGNYKLSNPVPIGT